MLRPLMLATIVLLTVGIAPVAGQTADCGNECKVCGMNSWEGSKFTPLGPYNMDCTTTGPSGGCSTASCPGGDTSVNEHWVAASAIAEVLGSASSSDVLAILAAYGDRLLYSPERGAMIVKGTKCHPNGIAAMVSLAPRTAHAFARMRARNPEVLPLLQDYLTAQAQVR